MEEERHKEELKVDPSLLPSKPYTWLLIRAFDRVNDNEKHIFYNIAENRYCVRFVPELKNKEVACCYGGWFVLRDWSAHDCSILNILTMEKFHLPPLRITHCVMSSSKINRSCRVILFEKPFQSDRIHKFHSCYIGDSEVIEGTFTDHDGSIEDLIKFKGKLYAVTTPELNLLASDFSDPGLHLEQVINGQSMTEDSIFPYSSMKVHLVESCEDLLLIYMSEDDNEISNVRIFKADFTIGEWVKLETIGDRAIFLGSINNSFSSPASALGMKGNVIYWVRFKDKSISMSSPVPIEASYFFSTWASFPIICNEEKKLERNYMSFLFEGNCTR